MPSSNWRHCFATGGCLAFLLLAIPALAQNEALPVVEDEPLAPVKNGADASGAQAEAQNDVKQPEELARALEKIEITIRDLISQQREAQRQGPANHEIRDLDAQETMAWGTEGMFWTAVFGLGLTLTGLILIYRTLYHERRAADAAQLTLDHLRKAERPLFVVTEITPEVFAKPFSAVTEHGAATRGRGVVCKAKASNFGMRPGTVDAIGFAYSFEPPPQEQPINEMRPIPVSKQIVPPNKHREPIRHVDNLDADFLKEIAEHQQHLCVHGFIRYSDMTGSTWRSGFAFSYITPEHQPPEGKFVQSGPINYWYDVEEKSEQKPKHGLWPWTKKAHD